jgi:hypothetical protein
MKLKFNAASGCTLALLICFLGAATVGRAQPQDRTSDVSQAAQSNKQSIESQNGPITNSVTQSTIVATLRPSLRITGLKLAIH